ncbi:dienelactone hydrolase family protein [Desulfosarcina sp.]|uniref:dienelactone hydrolase family protein n=1 Tax=Desulfosarcina sp. TaxID=2027861 RepID=UPI00397078D3
MKKTLFLIILISILSTGTALAKVVSQSIPYTHDGVSLEGFLAHDDAVSGKVPGILVVHEWWGLNEYIRSRAEQLARMGYVAFAVDMYGRGKSTEHPDQAAAWMKTVNASMDQWLKRATAGLDVLTKQPQVDTARLAAIGYCFGGATVQVLAYGGADLKGVVSFHGSLIPPSIEQAKMTRAKILIGHGATDPMNTPEAMTAYVNAMNASSIDWQLIAYGGTRHSFTNPDADKRGMAALAYSPAADRRSWQHMTFFFNELFSGM